MDYFLAVDFDGTVAQFDVTDAVLEEFAGNEWLTIEKLWDEGRIGSQECLSRQMALIETPLEQVLQFVETIPIDPSFISLIRFAKVNQIPLAIISDGFRVFIERILAKNGMPGLTVYANELQDEVGSFSTQYPYAAPACPSGTCKCKVAERAAQGLPVYLIGDGRSDFCLAQKADFVYAKAKLVDFCQQEAIPHAVYSSFQNIIEDLCVRQLEQTGIA